VDYDFSTIGTDGFERMAQTLVIAELGNHVTPTGVGRDGGRDCHFTGSVNYRGSSGQWDGNGVVQIKHRARDGDTTANRAWVKAQISKELARWKTGRGQRRDRRAKVPTYYLFVTGATLSPEGQDECLEALQEHCAEVGILDCAIWSRTEVARLLDNQPGIRQTYLHIIVPGDIVQAMRGAFSEHHADLAKQLTVGALRELSDRQWARLSDSGLQSDERLRLTSVAVDLPCAREGANTQPRMALKSVVEFGERDLRPSQGSASSGVLLMGGPGQGKSTIAQLLCQYYRSAFVEDSPALLPKQRELLGATAAALSRLDLDAPSRRRWPVYVDLSAFGDALAADEHLSLLRYIATSTIVHGQKLGEPELVRWRKAWPWTVVLDGLDEVAHPTIRARVTRTIEDFIIDCRVADANVLFVATTRPQGYHGELGGLELDELSLQNLTPDQALSYGTLLAETRYADDSIARDRIINRLSDASEAPLTSRLMSTPLQVTIMSTLLERATRVPETRHALFDAYYNAIYSREQAKATSLGDILTQHRPVVDFLHEQVALHLHVRAQHAGHAESLLDSSRLAQLVVYRLELDQHDEPDVRRLAEQIIAAARNRVVLLVGKHNDLLGYEIRPIQEYFAARALTSGSEAEIVARIEKLLPVAHWRNTLLLAFGRLEAHSNPQMPSTLVGICAEADASSPLALEVGPGRRLAMYLLADGFAANVPRVRRALLSHALKALSHWPDLTYSHLDRVLWQQIESDPTSRALAQQALTSAITGGAPAVAAACAILVAWRGVGQTRGTLANFVLGQDTRWHRRSPEDVSEEMAGATLRDVVSTRGLNSADQAMLENVLVRFDNWPYRRGADFVSIAADSRSLSRPRLPLPQEILRSDAVVERLLEAMNTLPTEDGGLAQMLREQLITVRESEPETADGLLSDTVLALLDGVLDS
jgi:hypothetical protein